MERHVKSGRKQRAQHTTQHVHPDVSSLGCDAAVTPASVAVIGMAGNVGASPTELNRATSLDLAILLFLFSRSALSPGLGIPGPVGRIARCTMVGAGATDVGVGV